MATDKRNKTIGCEEFVSAEAGPYLLPELIRFEGIDKCSHSDRWIIRAFTSCDRQVRIPISVNAVTSLLLSPEKEVQMDTWDQVKPWPDGIADPAEMPLLDLFVYFRLMDEQWCIGEFMNQDRKRMLVPLSFSTYQQLLNALKALPFSG